MLLTGPSNCFEIGLGGRNGRRVRDWNSMRFYNRKGKLSEKPDIILKNLDAELRRCIKRNRDREDDNARPADIRNHFGYYASLVVGSGHCGGTSWELWRSQFVNGIKNALTIEELANLGVNLYFSYYSYREEPNGKPATIDLKTEREYFIELKKWREWQTKTGHMPSLSFSPSSTDRVLARLRAGKRQVPKEKTRVEQDHYFVLTDGHYALLKYTSRGYRYSFSQSGGKRFRTKQAAETQRKQLIKRGRYQANIWKVKRIEGQATFQV